MSFPFNVRVYGALVSDGHLLLSHERVGDFAFVKLPGGGLEFGEGPKGCVEREFLEETGLEVKAVEHLYTTDFFQVSAFNKEHQVISIYYAISAKGVEGTPGIEALEKDQAFEWRKLSDLTENDFTFPIDKRMVPLLKKLGDR